MPKNGTGSDVHAAQTNVQRTPPTRVQLDTLRFVVEHVAQRGYPPTLQSIADSFGLRSAHASTCRLRAMKRRGWITNNEYCKTSAYAVTDLGYEALGLLAAGSQRPTAEPITGYCDPPVMRCERCARVLFGDAHVKHVCLAEDVESVRGAA